jgi:hypothetical protein
MINPTHAPKIATQPQPPVLDEERLALIASHDKEATLSTEQAEQLRKTFDYVKYLNEYGELNSDLREQLKSSKPILPAGTLVHGLRFDENSLRGIAKYGVISGQLQADYKIEDFETNFSADFFVLPDEQTISDYTTLIGKPVKQEFFIMSNPLKSYLPVQGGGSERYDYRVGVIVDGKIEEIQPLLDEDLYGEESSFASIARCLGKKDFTLLSAIPVGLPHGAIAGLIIGSMIVADDEKLTFMHEIFPNTPILDVRGNLV